MTDYNWQTGANGDWGVGGNWGGTVPNADTADVTLAIGTFTAAIANGESFTADLVTLAGTGATLAINGELQLSGATDVLLLEAGVLDLAGTLAGGTLVEAGGTVSLTSGATLEDMTVKGNLSLTSSGQNLYVRDGFTVLNSLGGTPGTIAMSAFDEQINFEDAETLSNLFIDLGASASTGYDFLSGNYALSIAASTTILSEGTSGNYSNLDTATLVNSGLITVTNAGLNIGANTFVNDGAFTIGTGLVQLNGTYDDNMTTINVVYAELGLDGSTFVNSGSIIVSAGSELQLNGNSFVNTGSISIGAGAELLVQQSTVTLGDISIGGGELVLGSYETWSQFSGVSFANSGTATTAFIIANGGRLNLGGANATVVGVDTFEVQNGGTLADGTANSFVQLASGATLDGVTYIGNLSLTSSGQNLSVRDGFTVLNSLGGTPGTIAMSAFDEQINFEDAETLSNLFIDLGASASTGYDFLTGNYALSIAASTTILSEGTSGNYSNLDTATLVNSGLITVTNAGLNIGANTFFNDGAFTIGTGLVQLNGTYDDNMTTINVVYAELDLDGGTFVNSGSIIVSAGSELQLNGNSFVNTGSISIGAGAELLVQQSTVTLGDISIGGGELVLGSYETWSQFSGVSFANSGTATTAFIIANGGRLNLGGANATVVGVDTFEVQNGGTLADGTANSFVQLASGATLDGVTYNGNLSLTSSGQNLYVRDGLTVLNSLGGTPGTIAMSAFDEQINFEDAETLSNLFIDLGASASTGYDFLTGNYALSIAASTTILSEGTSGNYSNLDTATLVNSGLITVTNAGLNIGANTFVNDGAFTIGTGLVQLNGTYDDNMTTINVVYAELDLDGGTFVNSGSIIVSAGSELLVQQSTVTLGKVSVEGGALVLESYESLSQFSGVTFADSGTATTEFIIASSGRLDLGGANATLAGVDAFEVQNGGTLADGTATPFVQLGNGATLDGITYKGNLTLAGSNENLYVRDGLTVLNSLGGAPGTIAMYGFADQISFQDAETLSNLFIDLGASASTGYDFLSGNYALSLAASTTILSEGTSGNYSNLDTATLVNSGLITVTNAGLYVSANTFFNDGAFTIGTGLVQLNGTYDDNMTTINVVYAELDLDGGTFVNSGSIIVSAGSELLVQQSTVTLGKVSLEGGALVLESYESLSQFSGVTFADSGTATTEFIIASSGRLDLGGANATLAGVDAFEVQNGGTLADGTATPFVQLGNGATLDGITYKGNLTLAGSNENLYVRDGLTVLNSLGGAPGTIAMYGFADQISFQDAETLSNLFIDLGASASTGYDFLSGNYALSLAASTTILSEGTSGNYSNLDTATLVNSGLITVTNAGLYVSANTFVNDGRVDIGAGSSLVGSNNTIFENDATIAANGVLYIDNGLTGTGLVQIGTLGAADLRGSVSSGETFSFDAVGGLLELGDPQQFQGTIASWPVHLPSVPSNEADNVQLDNFLFTSASFVSGTGLILGNGASEVTLAVTGTHSISDYHITIVGADTEITAICYLRGTNILTLQGERRVETLRPGDAVVTRLGGVRRIGWIGEQRFAGRFLKTNRAMLPVRIAPGALGGGLPLKPLFVSPGHSLLLNGIFVLARDLVNGVTITQDSTAEEVHYYNIELETHDCVLAEGAWAETYADGEGLRTKFHNAASFFALHPGHVAPDVPQLCAPRPLEGPVLEAALAPVLALAAAGRSLGLLCGYIEGIGPDNVLTGWAWDNANPELPVQLEILVRGELVGTVLARSFRGDLRDAGLGQGRCAFSFPLPRPAQLKHVHVRRAGSCEPLPLTADARRACTA